MMDFKITWLESRLTEALGTADRYSLNVTFAIFEHCMSWLQPVDLHENTPQDIQDRICDKMMENLLRHVPTVNLLSHITLLTATDSESEA
jgi:hypothetical protein